MLTPSRKANGMKRTRTEFARYAVTSLLLILLFSLTVWAQAASPPFIDNRNGTLTDKKSGLMWQKTDSYHDLKKGLNWYDALDYVMQKNGEGFAGYRDWRLPTMAELKTLWDPNLPIRSKDDEAIGLPTVFTGGGSYYLWTADERGLDFAWYFGLGQKEDYFNLKDSGDLEQGAKLVRNIK
ncbi:MAG: DUF1566 domain-containing protein [Nitrospinota bacterium]|nr:DUF1566 domain-containing protein [Nitrospinota bacterium]